MASKHVIDVEVRSSDASRKIKGVNKNLSETDKLTKALKKQFGTLFAGFGVALAVGKLRTLSDAFTEIQNQIRVVTDGTEELAAATDDLFEIATKTRAPVRELAILYQRASLAAENLGASQQDVKKFVEATGRAIAIQGGGMGKARGALIQLSQAIGGAVVRAEEFNSIQEGALPIILTVAKNIGATGISFAELRNRVIEGKVSSQEFFEAFLRGGADLEKAFGKTIPTIAQSFTVLNTAMIRFIGGSDDVVAASAAISSAIIVMSENLDLVIKLATIAGLALGTKYVIGLRAAAVANGALTLSAIAAARGQALFTAAMSAGSVSALALSGAMAVLRGAMAFLTGPIGIAVLVASFVLFNDALFENKKAVDKEVEALKKLRKESDVGAITSSELATQKISEAQSRQENIRSIIQERIEEIKLAEARLESALAAARLSKTGGLADISRTNAQLAELRNLLIDAEGELVANAAAIRQLFGQKTRGDIDAVTKEYEKLVKKLTGIIDPIGVATREFEILRDVLQSEVLAGNIDNYREALDRLKRSFGDALEPAKSFFRAQAAELKLLRDSRELTDAQLDARRDTEAIIKRLTDAGENLNEQQREWIRLTFEAIRLENEARDEKEEDAKSTDNLAASLLNLNVVAGNTSRITSQLISARLLLKEISDAGLITEEKSIELLRQLRVSYLGVSTGAQEFEERVKELDIALGLSDITIEQYREALLKLKLQELDLSREFGAGVERGVLRIKDSFLNFAADGEALVVNTFNKFESALDNFVKTGKVNFSEFARSIIADIAKIAIKMAVFGAGANGGGGGFLKGIIGGITSGLTGGGLPLPGFANGGQFTVGSRTSVGSLTGRDNRIVSFAARDGEEVSVTPPENRRRGGMGGITYNITTPDADSFRRSQRQIVNDTNRLTERAMARR